MQSLRAFLGTSFRHALPADAARYSAAAHSIANLLQEHVARARDGSLYWCHPTAPVGQIRPAPLGPHLYAGTLGIAYFLAAAWRVFGMVSHRGLAVQALAPMRHEIHEVIADPSRSRALRQPIGGLTGIGSIVYGLTRIGTLLDDRTMIDDAHAASALLTPERIFRDESLDVLTGSAGAILTLLALDQQKSSPAPSGRTPLSAALECADHLLARRFLWRSGPQASHGFCHGAAGISTALLRLYARTGRHEFLNAAGEGSAHDRGLSRPSADTAGSWCKGPPGIALSSLEAIGGAAKAHTIQVASATLKAARALPLSDTDDLCCGNAGRIDVFLHAWSKLKNPSHQRTACLIADAVLDRAQRRGSFALRLHGSHLLDLRLFNGVAGIGYAMLRLLATDSIPCILNLE